MKFTHFIRSTAAAALMALLLPVAVVRADDLQDINKLLGQGQAQQALDRVNGYLSSRPKDAQGRFLKGLILTELNKTQDAIQVFASLTEDYPELPEPYNNLAVLYASRGEYDKARSSLEMAIHTHPSYGTAHENLGDIYAKLASRAYDKAFQLDKTNVTAQTKLALIKDLFTKSGSKAMPAPEPAKPAPEAHAEAAARPAPKPEVVAKVEPPPAPPKVEPPKAEPAPAKAEPAPSKPEPARAAAAPAGGEEALKALQDWAAAWSAKDLAAYLAFYGPDFKVPGGSRAAWEKQRGERINKPGRIEVSIVDPKVSMTDADNAVVSFTQNYHSANLSSTNRKAMVMRRIGGRWTIVEERVNG